MLECLLLATSRLFGAMRRTSAKLPVLTNSRKASIRLESLDRVGQIEAARPDGGKPTLHTLFAHGTPLVGMRKDWQFSGTTRMLARERSE